MKKSKREKKSNTWKIKQHRDQFFKRSKTQGYRSRASFKLIELNKKFKFIKKDTHLLDLGSCPGGWTQVAERAQQLASLLNEEMPDVASMLGALPQQLLGANDSLNDNNSDRQRTGPPTTAQAQSPNQNNQHGRSGQGRGYERRHRGGSVFASAVIRTELRRRGWLVDILDRLVEAVSALEPKA